MALQLLRRLLSASVKAARFQDVSRGKMVAIIVGMGQPKCFAIIVLGCAFNLEHALCVGL